MNMPLVIEHAVAKAGDWDDAGLMTASISEFIFEKNWNIVGQLVIDKDTYLIAQFKAQPRFVLGRRVEMIDGATRKTRFALIFGIEMNPETAIGAALGYPALHRVFAVSVQESMRGFGIAKTMYGWLLKNLSITLIGDKAQYFGARRLWASLSRNLDSIVDIVDIKSLAVIERDVTLHHGRYDHDFDQRVWSYDQDKANLRVVLRDVGEGSS